MNFGTSLLFYVLIGLAVAGAIIMRRERTISGGCVFRAATAIVFWPLYLPTLLQPNDDRLGHGPAPTGWLGSAIGDAEAELDAALQSLEGWPDAQVLREQARFAELRSAWRQQASRIVELDALLARFESAPSADAALAESAPRLAASAAARCDNVARLRDLRRRLHEDLVGTLAKVRELVTLIHLARFSGAPAARAEELVAQIADAVAGLQEMAAWTST